MIQINNTAHPYRVLKNPRVNYNKNGDPFTTFSLYDTVKDAPPKTYQYFNCIVWNENIPLNEGDSIIITDISNVGARWYNGKTSINLSVKIEKVETKDFQNGTNPNFIPETIGTPTFADVKVSTQFADDDTSLPFDL